MPAIGGTALTDANRVGERDRHRGAALDVARTGDRRRQCRIGAGDVRVAQKRPDRHPVVELARIHHRLTRRVAPRRDRRAGEHQVGRIFSRRSDFIEALLHSRRISADGSRAIVRSDVHAGKWYLTGDGRVGLFDWQCMLHGLGVQDIAYALIGNLTVEHRRAWERELLELYRELPGEHGATNVPDSETVWLRYRQMVPHAMFMWLGTIGSNKLQPQMRKPEISLANIERKAQACADLDAFAALGM
jgi:hypothetical protein